MLWIQRISIYVAPFDGQFFTLLLNNVGLSIVTANTPRTEFIERRVRSATGLDRENMIDDGCWFEPLLFQAGFTERISLQF